MNLFSLSPSRRKIVLTISYYATFVCLGLAAAVLGPTLPSLAEGVNVNLNAISILFMAGSFGYLIGSSQGGATFRSFWRQPGHGWHAPGSEHLAVPNAADAQAAVVSHCDSAG